MAKFLKIRYNANGFLKNRIINADDINIIEPFSGPAGRYVDETRARIFMKDGTKYDMSTTVDDIQKILDSAGALVAEIHSTQPVRQIKAPATPTAPVSLYKRAVIAKSGEATPSKPAGNILKPLDAPRKPLEGNPLKPVDAPPRKPIDMSGLKPLEATGPRKPVERVLIKQVEAPRKQAEAVGSRA